MPRSQSELLQVFCANTHSFMSPEFCDEVNAAFGVILCPTWHFAGGEVKHALSLDNNARVAIGMAMFDLVPIMCRQLNVPYESKLGRGFQVRACVDALRAAGYGRDVGIAENIGSNMPSTTARPLGEVLRDDE